MLQEKFPAQPLELNKAMQALATNARDANKVDKIKKLAPLAGDSDKIEIVDFDDAYKKGATTDEYEALEILKKHGASQLIKKMADLSLSGATLEDLESAMERMVPIKDIDAQYDKLYGQSQQADAIPGVDLDYFASAGELDASGDFIKVQYKDKIKESTAEVIKAEIATHKNLVGIFEHYQKIGDAVKGGKIPSGMSAASIYNSLSVMKTLEVITNDLHGVASGYGFETLISLMMAGVTFGGKNGAADNLIQNLVNSNAKDYVSMSSKSGQGKMSGNTQSQNTIKAIESGETLWYFGFQRGESKEKAGESSVVKLAAVGIRRINGKADDKFTLTDFQYVSPDGSVSSLKVEKAGGKVKIPLNEYMLGIEVPILKVNTDTITALASTAIKSSNNEALKQIEAIQRNLAILREKTQVFVANSKRDKTAQAHVAANQAATAYKALKGELEGTGASSSSRKVKGGYEIDAATAGKFTESKLQSLDKLILEVLKENT